MGQYGIVEIFPFGEKNKCGYCKGKNGSLSFGMWAHQLTVQNYQALTERGWRRSGMYCYKPIMKETCCPQYTIRCDTTQFRLSKSQKSVLRRMRQFLINGTGKNMEQGKKEIEENETVKGEEPESSSTTIDEGSLKLKELANKVKFSDDQEMRAVSKVQGADPTKPPCKKAKAIRLERKMEKRTKETDQPHNKSNANIPKRFQGCQSKTLNDYIGEPLPYNAKHSLEMKMVRPRKNDREFQETFEAECALYKKYQIAVHNDKPEHCTTSQFQRFLVHSPLTDGDDDPDMDEGLISMGSFHQQYWLDSKLIAVGVIDILPNYVSSVYFFYDPDYNFLSLGNYGALREMAFTDNLHDLNSEIKYYLMGFYIHSCVKMRYKGQYSPSFLLCPETFTWQPIEKAKIKLDVVKYSRLEENGEIEETDSIVEDKDIMIFYQKKAMTFEMYLKYRNDQSVENEKRDIYFYAKTVGKTAAENILVYRS